MSQQIIKLHTLSGHAIGKWYGHASNLLHKIQINSINVNATQQPQKDVFQNKSIQWIPRLYYELKQKENNVTLSPHSQKKKGTKAVTGAVPFVYLNGTY